MDNIEALYWSAILWDRMAREYDNFKNKPAALPNFKSLVFDAIHKEMELKHDWNVYDFFERHNCPCCTYVAEVVREPQDEYIDSFLFEWEECMEFCPAISVWTFNPDFGDEGVPCETFGSPYETLNDEWDDLTDTQIVQLIKLIAGRLMNLHLEACLDDAWKENERVVGL